MTPMAKHHFTPKELAYHLSDLVNCYCISEYKFHPVRKWRFDYAFPCCLLAVEQEGAIHAQGRHTRGSGFEGDMAKYNAAAILGWRLLRFTPKEIETSTFTEQVEEFFALNPCPHPQPIDLWKNSEGEENVNTRRD